MANNGTDRVKSLRVGFTPNIWSGARHATALKLAKAETIATATVKCNQCGAPALRRFFDAKLKHYGRCAKHLSGGHIPRSYRKEIE